LGKPANRAALGVIVVATVVLFAAWLAGSAPGANYTDVHQITAAHST